MNKIITQEIRWSIDKKSATEVVRIDARFDEMMQYVLGPESYVKFYSILETNPLTRVYYVSFTTLFIYEVDEDLLCDEPYDAQIYSFNDWVESDPLLMERRKAFGWHEKALTHIGYSDYSRRGNFDPLLAMKQVSAWVAKVKPLMNEETAMEFAEVLDDLGQVRKFWQPVPHWIFRSQDLSVYEKAVLGVVRSYCWTTDNWFFRTVRDLALEVGCSERKARYALKSLVEKGYLRKKLGKKHMGTIKQAPSQYQSINAKYWDGQENFDPKE